MNDEETVALVAGGHAFGNRRVAADDGKVTPRAAGFWVGDFKPHPVHTSIAPLGPVKVHIALRYFFKHEARLGAPHLKLSGHIAFGHCVRLLVQKRSVHRVHYVFCHATVITGPLAIAEKVRPGIAGNFFG